MWLALLQDRLNLLKEGIARLLYSLITKTSGGGGVHKTAFFPRFYGEKFGLVKLCWNIVFKEISEESQKKRKIDEAKTRLQSWLLA